MVDRWFDVAQTVLDTPKAFAKSVAGAGAHAAEAYTEQAQKAAATVRPCVQAARTRALTHARTLAGTTRDEDQHGTAERLPARQDDQRSSETVISTSR